MSRKRTLTSEQVLEIRKRFSKKDYYNENGEYIKAHQGYKFIAKIMGLPVSQIRQICLFKTYKDIKA